MARGDQDRMADVAFRVMSAVMALKDLVYPTIDKRVATFGTREGMIIADYGCGPGRYTVRFAQLVGEAGTVYAVDVHELAIEYVKRKMNSLGLKNIIPVLATGYETRIPDHVADMVFALDMFFGVRDPAALLAEIHRILQSDGVLILDDGHQSRATTIKKVNRSGNWIIKEENPDHLRLTPQSG